ncbi:MAG TPA: hypothetical protein VII41_16165, partial [Steroidobacteraceae bacterium]
MGTQHGAGKERTSLIDRLSGNGSDVLSAVAADDLLAISGLAQLEVERVAVEAYRRQGYQVAALAADAGMLLTKDAQR